MTDEKQNASKPSAKVEDELWYLNNYVLLRDYYDRTISRIAARCVRKGNIAIEDYPFYGYILDVLEEIVETGDRLLANKEIYPDIDRKIAGGVSALRKNLKEYKDELLHNSTPEMIKEDERDLDKMKKALGDVGEEKGFDPTKGAGMGMDELMNKLMEGHESEQEKETPKMVKVKKAVATDSVQAVPEKSEIEE